MIEAVENHMPEVIVIDEIGTELEAQAARTIAERGVQLIGTAHGNNLDNLMLNPTLSDLIGGIQSVTLGDEEARRRRSQKSVLERKQPPTFDVIVEIQDREKVLVHARRGRRPWTRCCWATSSTPELRWRDEEGVHRSQSRPKPSAREAAWPGGDRFSGLTGAGAGAWGREPGWRGASTLPHGRVRGRGPAAGAARVPAGAVGRLARRPGAAVLGPRRLRTAGRAARRATDRPAERPARRAVRRHAGRADRPGAAAAAGRRSSPVTSPTAGRWSGPRGGRRPPPPRSGPATRASSQRQKAWRAEAARALNALREDEGTRPVNAAELEAAEEERIARMVPGRDRRVRRSTATATTTRTTRFGAGVAARSRAARCRRCACSRTASAASAWSRRSATCSCR